ncbi:MAG: peptidylprolyl isomerase [Desulforhopalus sp.]|nr:peptidylprolyl isomerase [Desulforhopalus sp.]
MTVKKDDTVQVHYKGTLKDGEVFDSSEGRDPLQFKVGGGQVIPGFEKGVIGMEVGEKKKIHIPCAEAYGERNPDMMIEAPLDQVPADLEPEVGMMLEVGGPGGELLRTTVCKISETHIYLDANAPLAGEDLDFEVELLAVK